MTELKFTCPNCRSLFEASEEPLGTVVTCPSCNKQIQLPQLPSVSNLPPLPSTEAGRNKANEPNNMHKHTLRNCVTLAFMASAALAITVIMMNKKSSIYYAKVAAAASAAFAKLEQSEIVLTGVVSKVIDGDTFHIVVDPSYLPPALKTSTDKLIIKLAGVESPELDQPFGQDIQRGLSYAMVGSHVIIHVGTAGDSAVEYDAYSRAVAHGMYVKGIQDDMRLMLIKKGMAWSTGGDNDLDAAQEAAHTRRIGLWRAADPVPPWDWRNKSQTAPVATTKANSETSDAKSFTFMVAGITHTANCSVDKIGPFTLPDDLRKRNRMGSGVIQ